MSKGHASPALYVALANAGFFPKEELKSFRKLGARLQGHIHPVVPGVELATGYLGQGLSAANGLALGLKMRGSEARVYCIMGDGEIQEGQIWEAAMFAAHHKLDRLLGGLFGFLQGSLFPDSIMGLRISIEVLIAPIRSSGGMTSATSAPLGSVSKRRALLSSTPAISRDVPKGLTPPDWVYAYLKSQIFFDSSSRPMGSS